MKDNDIVVKEVLVRITMRVKYGEFAFLRGEHFKEVAELLPGLSCTDVCTVVREGDDREHLDEIDVVFTPQVDDVTAARMCLAAHDVVKRQLAKFMEEHLANRPYPVPPRPAPTKRRRG